MNDRKALYDILMLTGRAGAAHIRPNPFPLTLPNGQVITDERCVCGRLRSEHADTFSYGHGPSFDGQCRKFTWSSMVEGNAK